SKQAHCSNTSHSHYQPHACNEVRALARTAPQRPKSLFEFSVHLGRQKVALARRKPFLSRGFAHPIVGAKMRLAVLLLGCRPRNAQRNDPLSTSAADRVSNRLAPSATGALSCPAAEANIVWTSARHLLYRTAWSSTS